MSGYAFVSLLSAVVCFGLGCWVWARKPRAMVNRLCALLCWSAAWWAFTEYGYRQVAHLEEARFWLRLNALWPFTMSLLVHLALVFAKESRLLSNKLMHALLYGPAAALALISGGAGPLGREPVRMYWGWTHGLADGPWGAIANYAWAVGMALAAEVICVRYYRQVEDDRKRWQTRLIMLGLAIPLVAGLISEALLPYGLGLRIPELSVASFLPGAGIVVYAMWKHGLFELTAGSVAESIVSTMSDALLLVDGAGKIGAVNRALREMTAYSESELVGRNVEDVLVVVAGQELQDVESEIKTKSGDRIPISLAASPMRDDASRLLGIVYAGRDDTERRRAEEALHRSESQYRMTLDAMADGIHVVDAGFRLILINNVYRGWVQEMGLETDVIGKGLFEAFPFLSQEVCEEYRCVLGNGEPLVTKERTEIGGRTVITEVRKIPVIEREQVIRVVTVVRDITEQERAKEELNQRGEEMTSLYQMAIDVTSQLDLEHLLQALIRRMTEVLGGSSGGFYLCRPSRDDLKLVVTYNMEGSLVGTVLKRGEGLSGRVLDSGETTSVEDYRRWDGRADVFEDAGLGAVIALPVMWGERLVGVVNVAREAGATFNDEDIRLMTLFASHIGGAIETAWLHGEAQRRVREMETLQRTSLQLTCSLELSAVLDGIAGGALELVGARDCHIYLYDDADETFRFGTALWNDGRRAAAVSAPRRDGLTAMVARSGQPVVINDALHHPLYAGYDAKKWGVQAIAGFPLKRAEQVLGVFTIAFVEPHVFGDDELRVLGLLADQTAVAIANARLYEMAHQRLVDWQEAEKQRRELEGQLRQSQKMEAIGLLAGGMAHDFNNLLTVIMGSAELSLLQVEPDDPVRSDLSVIKKTAERGASLTRQLLAFGRRGALTPRAVDLNQLIRAFAEVLERLLGETVELRLDLLPGLGLVMADESAVEQVLMNLGMNASDAMSDEGVLTITTQWAIVGDDFCRDHPEARSGEYARLTVVDTGVGMDKDTLDRLFEPFFTTKDVGKGTGLGLPVVYGIVKQHGGWIEVESEVSGGTRVDAYLPGVEGA